MWAPGASGCLTLRGRLLGASDETRKQRFAVMDSFGSEPKYHRPPASQNGVVANRSSARSRRLALIEAPSSLGLRPPAKDEIPGARLMPAALREAGLWSDFPLAAELSLRDPPYEAEPDGETGVRNIGEMIVYTREIAEAVANARRRGHIPVVIGGDCSILLGAVFALKQVGRYALVHVDGHADFAHEGNQGRPYPNIAGADLAVATGRGPNRLANLDGLGPYVRDDDVYQLGEKDDATAPDYWFKDYPKTAIRRYPFSAIRAEGLSAVLRKTGEQIATEPTEGFWVHLDLDVLDSQSMPAVDSPQTPGFTWEELDLCLAVLLSHPKFSGIDFTIYDPTLDPERVYARELAQHIKKALSAL